MPLRTGAPIEILRQIQRALDLLFASYDEKTIRGILRAEYQGLSAAKAAPRVRDARASGPARPVWQAARPMQMPEPAGQLAAHKCPSWDKFA